MKKRKRKTGWYVRVAKAIEERRTFDVEINGGGWTTPSELIANYMLRQLNDHDRFLAMKNGLQGLSLSSARKKKFAMGNFRQGLPRCETERNRQGGGSGHR